MISRYAPINPIKFRRGDLVEAQFSFSAIPVKEKGIKNTKEKKKYKLLLTLRGITLLDAHNTMVVPLLYGNLSLIRRYYYRVLQ
jgi:hypothetical protein